jgi:hypothetical protein
VTTTDFSASGEVTEREDLLDGRVRVALQGTAGPWQLDAVIGWRRGRTDAIEVEPEDTYLTLFGDGGEFNAAAVGGTVTVDPDTAAADVEAALTLERGAGSAERPARDRTGAIEVALNVGLEAWSGTVRLDLEAADQPS